MKNSLLKYVVFVWCLATAAQAQSVFKVTSIGGQAGFSAGYFLQDGNTGQFQLDILSTLPPVDTDNANAQISTPAGTLTFSIGVGTATDFNGASGNMFPDPFYPEPVGVGHPLVLSGEQYNGSFASSPSIYTDLLAGEGQFSLFSGATVYATGTISVVAVVVPEPRGDLLCLCGVLLLGGCFFRKRTVVES
jgi:hypothetical protein